MSHNSYKVSKSIRDMVIFSHHDVTYDPPFIKIDLLVCRNLLIYFNTSVKNRLLPMFHYALANGGLLFLGRSESIDAYQNLFSPLAKESRVYKREFSESHELPHSLRTRFLSESVKAQATNGVKLAVQKSMKDSLLESLGEYFLPLSIVVNEGMDIVYIKERNPYISHAAGSATTNVYKSIHESLTLELRTLLQQCIKDDTPQVGVFKKVELYKGLVKLVRLIVMPLKHHQENSKLFVVSFQEESSDTLSFLGDFESGDANQETVLLRLELSRVKQHLQAVIDELDNSNSELQSLNEEMQSANEELQSTNEELETTNEELQGTNEELLVAYNEIKAANDEREDAEKRVEMLKARQQLLYSLLVAAIYFRIVQDEQKNVDLVCEIATRPCEKITRLLAEEMVGKKIDELFPQEFYQSFIELCKSMAVSLQNGEMEIETDYFGETMNYKVIVTTCKDGVIVSFDDITKIKTTLTQLERIKESVYNEKILRDELIEDSSALVAVLDEKGSIINFNNALEEVTGYTKQEVVGSDWFATFVPSWRVKELRERYREMVFAPERGIWKSEYNLRLKDGSEKPISWQSSTHIGKDGSVNILIFGIDVTLHSLLEQQMKLQDDYLHAVTNIRNTITVITDGQHIIDVNNAFFAFFNEFDSLESFQKEHDCVCDYFEKTDEPNFVYDGRDGKNWLDIMAGEGIHQALIKKDGEEYIFALHLLEFNTALNNRKIVSMTNVTELEKHRLYLENQIVEESKRAKMQEQLIIQQGKMAALGEMLAAIAHQWRQPLNALSIMTQDVKMAYEANELDGAYIDEFNRDAMRVIQHMSSTIDGFRDFFKPTTHSEEFLARNALSQSLGIFSPQLSYSKIALETIVPKDSCDKLFCNKNQLMQVLMSVISNAKDATMEAREKEVITDGAIRTEVSCQGQAVFIKVYNSGACIPEEVRARVFEPYYTTKEQSKGTGIGLYLSKVIVEQHLKGKISIDNIDGGVEVTIELPMAQQG